MFNDYNSENSQPCIIFLLINNPELISLFELIGIILVKKFAFIDNQ